MYKISKKEFKRICGDYAGKTILDYTAPDGTIYKAGTIRCCMAGMIPEARFLKDNKNYFHGYRDYFPISGKVKNLLDSLSKYCQCVETYENELLWYQSNETKEINKAINNKLIAAITGGINNG